LHRFGRWRTEEISGAAGASSAGQSKGMAAAV